jgi:hypothetical protein
MAHKWRGELSDYTTLTARFKNLPSALNWSTMILPLLPISFIEENAMDKRTTGIIATVATALLCGCPGLFGLCMGAMFAVVSQVPGADIDMYGSNDPAQALTTGLIGICGGIIFIIIPIVVGFLTLRKKAAPAPITDEPLPPTS